MEKIWKHPAFERSGKLKQWLFMLKLTLLFCFLSILSVHASLFSQTKVTLSMKNVTLKDVIWEIEQQTGMVFMYTSEDLDKAGRMDIRLKAEKMEEVLQKCLKNSGLTYSVKNDVIVLQSAAPQQETRKITGLVKTATGEALPGVTILIKGTSVGVATDIDGKYTIVVTGIERPVLVFSSVGMTTQEIPVGKNDVMNVTLKEDNKNLEEVVIVGYQTVHKRNTTGSISSVRGDAIADIPAASITELLSGKVTGLQSLSTAGGPGSKTALVLRGNTVISGSLGEANQFSDPLYVIDGIPTTLQDIAGYDATNTDYLASLNPDDVESIDILKDASAAAIYGSRGANGVVIIKTKGGRAGKMQVSAKASFGVTNKPSLRNTPVGAAERRIKLDLVNKWWPYSTRANADAGNAIMVLTDSLNPAFNNNIDYQGLFYQTGYVQSYDVSLNGGTAELNYRLSLGYYGEKGIVKATGYDRYSLSLNVSQILFKALKNNTVIRMSYGDRKTGMGDNSYAGHNIFPVSPQDMNSSLFTLNDEQRDFLVGKLSDLYNTNRNLDISLSNLANLDLYKGIVLNSQIGLVYGTNRKNYFQPSTVRDDKKGYATHRSSQRMSANIETYLSYTNDIAQNHNLNVLLGNTFDFNQYEDVSLDAIGGSGDMIKVINGFRKEDINGNSSVEKHAMISYWARLGYRFMDRYMIDFNFRRDASSRFGRNKRWGNFPAISAGWIVSDEPFMKSTENWLSFAKVKASYGKNGSQFSSNYLRYNLYKLGQGGVGDNSGTMSTNTYNGVQSTIPDFTTLADNNLSWEESKQWDIGFEGELFDRRVFLTVDGYNRRTDALLFDVNFPGYTGFSNVKANAAGIMNYGYEITVNGFVFDRNKEHQIEIQAGVSHNSNKITKLPNGNRDYRAAGQYYGYSVGKPGPIFYGLKYTGPLDKLSDLPTNPFTGQPLDPTMGGVWGDKPYPGFPMFDDVNGDYLVSDKNDQDEGFIEKDPNPKVLGHLNLVFSYKQWKLRANTEFVFGRDIFDKVSQSVLDRYGREITWVDRAMIDSDEYDFWDGEGSGGYYPALVPSGVVDMKKTYPFRSNSSMWWENGNYWKINDLTLSYNFDQSWMKKIGFDRIYLYATMYNVWQWQASDHVIDASMVDSRGYTYGDGYPAAHKYVFGINVQF